MDLSEASPDDFHPIFLITAAEALSGIPVLEGRWETKAWDILVPLGRTSRKNEVGHRFASTRLSNWIIRVVGDPDMCPNLQLRLQMLLLYRTVVNIDDRNRKQALDSLMSICSSLDSSVTYQVTILDIQWCLHLFTKDNYLHQFSQRLVDKIRCHRNKRREILLHDISHEYGMGLKTLTEPRETKSLIALLKYFSDGARINKTTQESIKLSLQGVASGLTFIIRNFGGAFKQPEMLSVTAESVMDVMEAIFSWAMDHKLDCLAQMERMLWVLCIPDNIDVQYCTMQGSPVGKVIIRRYKGRIIKLREMLIDDFFETYDEGSMIYDLLYNAEY